MTMDNRILSFRLEIVFLIKMLKQKMFAIQLKMINCQLISILLNYKIPKRMSFWFGTKYINEYSYSIVSQSIISQICSYVVE